MRSTLNKVRNVLDTRAGFFALVFLIFWIKTYVVYVTKFSLGITGPIQKFLLIVNPLPFGLLLFGIALYFKGKKSYWIMMIVDLIESLWLFPMFCTIVSSQISYQWGLSNHQVQFQTI